MLHDLVVALLAGVCGLLLGALLAMGMCHAAGHKPWWTSRTWRERTRSTPEGTE